MSASPLKKREGTISTMSNQMAVSNPLGTERIGKLMVRFAVPSIISLVVNSLYNMVDQIFIGQSVGYLGHAATNVILPFTIFLLAVCLMIGDGAAAYMSLNLGRGDEEEAARGVGSAVTLAVAVGIFLMIIYRIFLNPLCVLFGASENSMPYALAYGSIILLGVPFSAIDSAFGGIIRADGRPKTSMTGLLIGCITNMILDPIFIFKFHWGVQGAAWATIIGQILNAIYFVFSMTRCKSITLKKKAFIPNWKTCRRFLSLGISSFITQVAAVLVIMMANNLLVNYGARSKYGPDIPLAAFGIAMKVSQLITSVVLGIASGIQPILGFNYGAGRYERVKKAYKLALKLCMLILTGAFFVFQFCPQYIILLFGQESELYMEFAVKCFRIYLMACVMIAPGMVTGIFFQAIGRPVPAMILSLSRQILILLPSMILLSGWIGVEGVLWAGVVGDTLSGSLALLMVRARWNRIFQEKKQTA